MNSSVANDRSEAARSVILSGVRKVYRIEQQNVEALRGADLEMAHGKIAALVGKSGAGKSTLLHIIGEGGVHRRGAKSGP